MSDKDHERLDWLETWIQRSAREGFKWNNIAFVVDKPIRHQIDEWIAAERERAVQRQGTGD